MYVPNQNRYDSDDSTQRKRESKAVVDPIHFAPAKFDDIIPEPDYDENEIETVKDTNYINQPGMAKQQNNNNTSTNGLSSFELSIQKAAQEREMRKSTVNEPMSPGKRVAPIPPSTLNVPAPPPPPPTPPLIKQSPTLPQASKSFDTLQTTQRSSVPPQVQKQLEETKKQEDSHAALMAAVMKRRNHIDTTPVDEIGQSIECRVSKTQKLQIVYSGGENGKKEVRSPVQPVYGLLGSANSSTTKSFDSVTSSSYSSDNLSNPAGKSLFGVKEINTA